MADIVDNRIRHTLVKPVLLTFRNSKGEETIETVTELVFKEEAEGADFMVLDPKLGEMRMIGAFAARMAGVSLKVIEKLGRDDFWKVMDIAKDFLPDTLATSGTASES